jgi:type IV pilus assembly protein PilO
VDIGQAFSDLQNLEASDLKQIGSAPLGVRATVLVLGLAAIIGCGIWFLVKPMFLDLERIAATEETLKIQFDSTQAKAANREAYVEQLTEMKRTFNVMLRQLPNKTDIESLLIDLSQTSVAAGLEVEFFKPEKEIAREFYVEYPIRISVTGNYHQFGNFVSGLAALPRIVTLHNIAITPGGANQNNNQAKAVQKLKMDLTATTYRYLEDDEA